MRSKALVNSLHELKLSSTYTEIMNIEIRLATGVISQMNGSNGYFLPEFVKKGQSIFLVADNVDFLENTPDGQNTLQGTILAINQNNFDVGQNMIQPMVLSETASPLKLQTDCIDAPKLTAASP